MAEPVMADALSLAYGARQFYWDHGQREEEDATLATDILADQLRALPEDEWFDVIRRAVMHAHEEIHGWGTAADLHIEIKGLEYRDGD